MRSNWRAAGTRNWRASWPTASPTKRRSWTGRLAVSWEAPGLQPQVLDISAVGSVATAATAGLRKDDHMKHMKHMAIGTLLLLGVSGASAQSLGDYARAVRKNKAEPSSTSRHFDNDNLPTNQTAERGRTAAGRRCQRWPRRELHAKPHKARCRRSRCGCRRTPEDGG